VVGRPRPAAELPCSVADTMGMYGDSASISRGQCELRFHAHRVRRATGARRTRLPASLMLDAGADVRHVAELLGHAKLETTMTYTRVSVAKPQAVHAACHPAERGRG
jgi:site-specific recombinase XerC